MLLVYHADGSDDYVLVNFIEEGCAEVVPLSRVRHTADDNECFVLWDNRKEYSAYYLLRDLLSGKLYTASYYTVYS